MNDLDKLVGEIKKNYGDKAIYRAAEMPSIQYVHSGSLTLDFPIGTGGIPANRVIEIYGQENTGKTTLALLMASQQLDHDPDRYAIFIDMEHKLTPDWMEKLVGEERMERFLVLAPDTIEQATEMYRQAVTRGMFTATILDSIGGAPTNQNMDLSRSADGSASPGGNSKGVSEFAKIAANLSAKYDCATIGINQLRDKIGARVPSTFTPGGRQWKHRCILRIRLTREYNSEKYATINGEKVLVGYGIEAQVVKNHSAGGEGRVAAWNFYSKDTEEYGPVGIDTVDECLKLSQVTGVISRGGSYYTHPAFPLDSKGLHRINGKEALAQAIREDKALRMTIASEVMAALNSGEVDIAEVAPIKDMPTDEEDDETPPLTGGTGMAAVGKRVRRNEGE